MRVLYLWILSFFAGVLCDIQCSKKADIAFVIDSSSSIWPPNFVTQKHFVYDVLGLFDISPTKTQVAALSYSTIIKPEFQFNTYQTQADVRAATQEIEHTKGDSTRTYRAIRYMNDVMFSPPNGARSDVFKIGIVMTDGETNPGSDGFSLEEAKKMTLQEAQRAKDNGIYLIALGVGDEVTDKELFGIASEPSAVIKVKTYEEFNTNKLKQMLVDKMCEVGETITTTKKPSQEVQCTQRVADLIFAIDQSTSIGSKKQFGVELDFVNDLIKEFDIGADATRVGAVAFSNDSQRVLDLRDGVDLDYVTDKIHNIEWKTGNTYMNKAFRDMKEGFSPAKGGRPGLVPQVAVVVTDGDSTNPYATKTEADALKEDGVKLFTIGVQGAKREYLEKYATDPNHVFYADNLNALKTIAKEVSQRVCESISSS